MGKTIFEKICEALEIENKANSVQKDGENGIVIEFGKVLTGMFLFDKKTEQKLKLKKLNTCYELSLFKRKLISLNGRTYSWKETLEGKVVVLGFNEKTEEKIYNFVISYINNADNAEKQKSLVDEFNKGIQ